MDGEPEATSPRSNIQEFEFDRNPGGDRNSPAAPGRAVTHVETSVRRPALRHFSAPGFLHRLRKTRDYRGCESFCVGREPITPWTGRSVPSSTLPSGTPGATHGEPREALDLYRRSGGCSVGGDFTIPPWSRNRLDARSRVCAIVSARRRNRACVRGCRAQPSGAEGGGAERAPPFSLAPWASSCSPAAQACPAKNRLFRSTWTPRRRDSHPPCAGSAKRPGATSCMRRRPD